MLEIVDAQSLRREFPVLERFAYLNAGTDGPLPARAALAAQELLEREAREGRVMEHFQRRHELGTELRAGYARVLGCAPEDVALTTCTSEGLTLVINGLRLGGGEEILTGEDEHPGLLGALQTARELGGVSIRTAPLERIADAVGPRTALVACSHVSWMSGRCAQAELAQVEPPVLLDGAQGAGAIPLDLAALGCDAYAAAGQKWLCGPDGTGMLYVSPALRERVVATQRGYTTFADPGAGLDAQLHPDCRRYDTHSLSGEALTCAVTALAVLEEHSWPEVYARAIALAARLARELAERGREVAPRDDTTLVAFRSSDCAAELARLRAAGVLVRSLPGEQWLRASVGAWNDERDLERLLGALA